MSGLSRALAIGLAASLLSSATAASPAFAARLTVHDARGDAKAPWDIEKLVAGNGRRALVIRVVYRGRLRTWETPTGLLTHVGLDTGARARRVDDGDHGIDLLRGSPSPDLLDLVDRHGNRMPCRGLRVKLRKRAGVIRFRLPQRCLGADAGRVRVSAYSYRPRGDPDEADYIERWSRWVARG